MASGDSGTLGGANHECRCGWRNERCSSTVRCIDSNGKIHILQKEDMNFGYRTSRIQTTDLIVSEVNMELEYGDQQESLDLMADLARRRREKQPLAYPSAGSTFKRPVGYYAGKLIQDCGPKAFE